MPPSCHQSATPPPHSDSKSLEPGSILEDAAAESRLSSTGKRLCCERLHNWAQDVPWTSPMVE